MKHNRRRSPSVKYRTGTGSIAFGGGRLNGLSASGEPRAEAGLAAGTAGTEPEADAELGDFTLKSVAKEKELDGENCVGVGEEEDADEEGDWSSGKGVPSDEEDKESEDVGDMISLGEDDRECAEKDADDEVDRADEGVARRDFCFVSCLVSCLVLL